MSFKYEYILSLEITNNILINKHDKSYGLRTGKLNLFYLTNVNLTTRKAAVFNARMCFAIVQSILFSANCRV